VSDRHAICRPAAGRIIRLWLDLRRQAEAWSAGESAPEIAEGNPDVAAFNRSNVSRALESKRAVLVDAVAAILVEELDGVLEAERDRLTACPDCQGSGKRWYALYGMATCERCGGGGIATR
jgi:hypothetical protein